MGRPGRPRPGELPSDSEDENLIDSDEDFDLSETWLESESSDYNETDSDDSAGHESAPNATSTKKNKNNKKRDYYNWTKVSANEGPMPTPQFTAPLREDEPEIGRPIHYFQLFFTNELLNYITEQSNLYAIQTDPNKPLQLTRSELEIFIGTIIYMYVFALPRSRLFWKNSCNIPQVANWMSRKRWEAIKRHVHFNNNENLPKDKDDPNYDKLFKIRPVLNNLQEKFKNQEKPQMLCVDEQIIPYKGMSSLKQYNPKKPNKWGYKVFVLCDNKGLIHNFEVYTGKILPVPEKEDIGASGNIVLRLASVIPTHQNYLLYCDNWFSSIKLMTSLYRDGVYTLGTIRRVRIPGLQLPTDSAMKKRGRGIYDEFKTIVDNTIEVRVLQWFDNKSVRIASTFSGAKPVDIVQRFDRTRKTRIDVSRPNMIKQYNMFMGRVDLLDGLLSYYRISLRSRKWYLRIFFHLIDLCLVTAWIKYRSDMLEVGLEKKDILDSLGFRCEVAEALTVLGKHVISNKRGRPSGSSVEREYETKKKKGPTKPIPQFDVRTD